MWMIPAVFVGIFVIAMLIAGAGPEEEHTLGWHRRNGEWRVLYPDGQRSQPFSRKVAEDYAEMFGGKVIPR